MSIEVNGSTIRVTVQPRVQRVTVSWRGSKGEQGDAGEATPLSDDPALDLGTASAGDSDEASRANHVHKLPGQVALISDPRDYGLVEGTGVSQAQKVINLAAMHEAIAAAMDDVFCEVWIAPGTYEFSGTVHVNAPVTIRGAGEQPNGTTLIFPRGVDGFSFDYNGGPVVAGGLRARLSDVYIVCEYGPSAWGTGAAQTILPVTVFIPSNAAGSYQGFCFVCTTAGGAGTVDPFIGFAGEEGDTVTSDQGAVFTARYIAGVRLLTQARIERVRVAGFGGDGFSVFASTGDSNNANGALLDACTATDNVGWGFFTQGADSNACLFTACNAFSNGGNYHTYTGSERDAELKDAYGGFCDNSFVGNTYNGCAAEGNRGFGYLVPRNALVGGVVNESRFFGCYSEGGQINALNQKAAWIYGTTGPENVYGVGNKIGIDWSSPHYFQTDSVGDGTGDTSYMRATRPLSRTALELGWSQDSNRPTQWSYGNVNGGTTPGWAAMVYNGNLSPFAWSLNDYAGGGGLAWLPSRAFLGPFASEVKPQRLSGAMELFIGGVGATDSLVSHVWNRENGTESLPFATLTAALAYCPKDLNGFTLTITDNRSGAGEAIDTGGFINGTLALVGARLIASTFRDCALLQLTSAVITGIVTLLRCTSEVTSPTLSGAGAINAGLGVTEVAANSDGTQATATVISTDKTLIATCAVDGYAVRFGLIGTDTGWHLASRRSGELWNGTANLANVYPPLGGKIIMQGFDLGTNNPAPLPGGQRFSWIIDSAGVFYVS